ncbi:MAG: hypothetical protein ILO42_05855, partial [Clostridia bacterium]|nr:hypothetical protein [Clostridia bacterium]
MIYEISNGLLTAAVSSRGAELIRLSANGRELLWSGDSRYWEGRSPNLFPVCGRLRGGRFSLCGREYDMPAHGFLKDADLRLAVDAPDMIGFELMSDTGIANSWPFDFRASVVFRLAGRSLTYEINVENVGKKDMPFAWGGHPGFALPFESEPLCDFEDYSIVFSEPCRPVAMEITPDGFVGEGRTPVALEDGVRLPLRRAYFAVD